MKFAFCLVGLGLLSKLENLAIQYCLGPDLLLICFIFQEYGENLYTIEEVILELKDKKTKDRLKAFPFEIKRRQPQPTYIKQSKF